LVIVAGSPKGGAPVLRSLQTKNPNLLPFDKTRLIWLTKTLEFWPFIWCGAAPKEAAF
jgi:hypothetical protein